MLSPPAPTTAEELTFNLKCEHGPGEFHAACLKKWQLNPDMKATCPVCRNPPSSSGLVARERSEQQAASGALWERLRWSAGELALGQRR